MNKKTTVILGVGVLLVVCLAVVAWWASRNLDYLVARVAGYALQDAGVPHATELSALVPTVLGFDAPHTMLVLLLNNTEMRPGGGFIGSYALVTFDKGEITQLVVDGSENIDRNAPPTFLVEPPVPIQKYLAQPRWFFRDANWSPDFAESAQRALKFYAAEGGVGASQVDSVIGITPEIVSGLLAVTGPITVRGTTYTSETVRDLLEYVVEIEYLRKQIPFTERKVVMQEFAIALAQKIRAVAPRNIAVLIQQLFELASRGHIMVYSHDASLQQTAETLGWAGRQQEGVPDYVQLVDANLASLKTDRVVDRRLSYYVWRDSAGVWNGRVKAIYQNKGWYDWRTTRYQTYTRLYLPAGTKFLSGTGSMEKNRSPKSGTWDVYEENGRTVIGAFISIEPSAEGVLEYHFLLAPSVARAISAGAYGLYVQKQLGLPKIDLTMRVDFGTSIASATPSETTNNFSDQTYEWSGTLLKDLTVYVRTKNRY